MCVCDAEQNDPSQRRVRCQLKTDWHLQFSHLSQSKVWNLRKFVHVRYDRILNDGDFNATWLGYVGGQEQVTHWLKTRTSLFTLDLTKVCEEARRRIFYETMWARIHETIDFVYTYVRCSHWRTKEFIKPKEASLIYDTLAKFSHQETHLEQEVSECFSTFTTLGSSCHAFLSN